MFQLLLMILVILDHLFNQEYMPACFYPRANSYLLIHVLPMPDIVNLMLFSSASSFSSIKRLYFRKPIHVETICSLLSNFCAISFIDCPSDKHFKIQIAPVSPEKRSMFTGWLVLFFSVIIWTSFAPSLRHAILCSITQSFSHT